EGGKAGARRNWLHHEHKRVIPLLGIARNNCFGVIRDKGIGNSAQGCSLRSGPEINPVTIIGLIISGLRSISVAGIYYREWESALDGYNAADPPAINHLGHKAVRRIDCWEVIDHVKAQEMSNAGAR